MLMPMCKLHAKAARKNIVISLLELLCYLNLPRSFKVLSRHVTCSLKVLYVCVNLNPKRKG